MFKAVNSSPNFPQMEKKWLKYWYEKGIVKKYLSKNNQKTRYFSFLDGPITANNPMGVHHAWGRTYKDLWPRFYNLLGYQQRFQNGFDCQGLWVEVEVEKELKLKSKKEIENLIPRNRKASIAKFVALCKDRVMKYSAIQTAQSKRLGYFADWDHSYFTMSDENNYMIWYFLKKCYENGWIYKGRESVPWCPRCETAISQHEMLTEDYKEAIHESIYFKLKILNPKSQIPNKSQIQNSEVQNEYLLVWTTTPWTIPANIAVAIDQDTDYALVEFEGNKYWLAKERIKEVFNPSISLRMSKTYKIVKIVNGRGLVGLKYEGPFDSLSAVKKTAETNKKFHVVFATDQKILPVTTIEGTGMVHTAVSAGTEDFLMGKKLGLPMIPVIADNADYLPGLGFLTGQNAKKNPRIILDYMVEKGFAFKIESYKHRYPSCWRCKTELVWKVADEWYIAMDRKSSKFKVQSSKLKNETLRQRMIKVAKKINWLPRFGLERELDWLKNMHDWLISKKNRYWGLALPIYECKKCGWFEVVGSKEELKAKAVSGWREFVGHTPHKPYIDEVMISCAKCHKPIKRVNDVGNPWLDAGIVAYSTITENNRGEQLYFKNKTEWRRWFPADFITESFPGQFKNWFYSLIAMSTVLENDKPFKTVLGFGTLLGEDGRPMHKSWGNMIEFNEGAEKIGVDVMRWLYCRQEPAENLLFGYKKADEVRRQFYLLLWNIYKFFVEYANLDKFEILNSKSQTNSKLETRNSLTVLDRWILNRFNWLIEYVEKRLKEYNAKNAALEIEDFVNNLSMWYIRRSRDRVWVNSEHKKDKQAFYNTLYFILTNLSIILSPFLPFISEEMFTNLTGRESVSLSDWPAIDKKKHDPKLDNDMKLVREIVEAGHRVRKEIGIKVRQPLAQIKISLPRKTHFQRSTYEKDYLFLIKKELNSKTLVIDNRLKNGQILVNYDTRLTQQLIKEGQLRELIRKIQETRKRMAIKQDQLIVLTIPKDYLVDIDFLKKKVMARKIIWGEELRVE